VIYRCFAVDGSLLYVGQSIRGADRIAQHAATKDWWPEVASITLEHFPTRELLDEAERAAIAAEDPRYNLTLRLLREEGA